MKRILTVGDAVEYVDPEHGMSYPGTVLAVDSGSGWGESTVRVQWRDMGPTWMRASRMHAVHVAEID